MLADLIDALMIIGAIMLFAAWIVTVVAFGIGPCSSTAISRKLQWRIAPSIAGAGAFLVAVGVIAHIVIYGG
jgi:hypothetical protein